MSEAKCYARVVAVRKEAVLLDGGVGGVPCPVGAARWRALISALALFRHSTPLRPCERNRVCHRLSLQVTEVAPHVHA